MAARAVVEQFDGVRSLRPHGGALGDPLRHPREHVPAGVRGVRGIAVGRHQRGEAGALAGMAGRSGLGHAVQDGVAVAVHPDLANPLHVAGRLPLLPEGAAGPAVVVGEAAGSGLPEGVPVGIGQHQDVAGPAFLCDDRNQSLGIELDGGQPGVVGHGVKVPGGSTIVKSRCTPISCSIIHPLASRRSPIRVARKTTRVSQPSLPLIVAACGGDPAGPESRSFAELRPGPADHPRRRGVHDHRSHGPGGLRRGARRCPPRARREPSTCTWPSRRRGRR